MKKSTFKYADYDKYTKQVKCLWYEYRGKEYEVNPNLYTSTAYQHREAQKNIDSALDDPCPPKHEYTYEDTAEYCLNKFFEEFG